MTKQEWRALCAEKRVILDGATGSCLQKAGMPTGVCPEKWILENPEVLIGLQEEYLKAGTDILYAPTFSGNRIKLEEYGLADKLEEMNRALVGLSKEAIKRSGKKAYVAADITMTGQQLAPIGTLDFEDLITIYKEQLQVLVDSGVDLIVVETMMSLQECRAALIATKEICDLPVMITLTFTESGRTFYGTDPETAMVVLQGMGADAVGMNCSTGPDKLHPLLEEMLSVAEIPVIVKPNAGLPALVNGETVYSMGPQEFAEKMIPLLESGAQVVGGCCGTTPEHIRQLALAAGKFAPVKQEKKALRVLSTERKTLHLPLDGRFIVIGERINPTGKKALQEQLRNGCFDMVGDFAEAQVEAGADILDVNMGMNGIDEKATMLQAIEKVISLTDVPVCIDSSHSDIIEAALRRYPGRALINSISLEPGKMEKLLPAAKKYGAMFILLPLSEKGLPKDMAEKKEIIHTILSAAEQYGLSKENVLVDGLVNTVGANPDAALQALETIRYCKDEIGVATMCGLSNISFGLPERQFVNAAFLSFAIQAGITAAIVNPSQTLLMNMAFASDLLRGKTESDIRYIEKVGSRPMTLVETARLKALEENGNGAVAATKAAETQKNEVARPAVFTAVMKGNRSGIVDLVKAELNQTSASDILNTMLIPAINEVGELFNQQKYFLPQLIASAEAMKIAIEFLEPELAKGAQTEKLGTVVIATVAGDIHDIGKNLVALMLKNYGFDVIDLGKDVPNEEVIRVAKEKDADIIAASALMTTTMQEMKEIVRLRNEEGLRAKIMIGGAVITQSYCDEIGADGYSKDAQEAVVVAKKLIGK